MPDPNKLLICLRKQSLQPSFNEWALILLKAECLRGDLLKSLKKQCILKVLWISLDQKEGLFFTVTLITN